MGVFDSILGFLNPEVISTYNDLVNNHSEAFRRWRGKQIVGTLSSCFDLRPTYNDKLYVVNHKKEILDFEKIIAEEKAYDKRRQDVIQAASLYPHAFYELVKKLSLNDIPGVSVTLPGNRKSKYAIRLENEARLKKGEKSDPLINPMKIAWESFHSSDLIRFREFQKKCIPQEHINRTAPRSIDNLDKEEYEKIYLHINELRMDEDRIKAELRKEDLRIQYEDEVLANERRKKYHESFLVFSHRSQSDIEYLCLHLSELDAYALKCIDEEYAKIAKQYPFGLSAYKCQNTYGNDKEIIIHKIDEIQKLDVAQRKYNQLKKKYPKGLPALERYYTYDDGKNSADLSIYEIVEREDEICLFEKSADEASFYEKWIHSQEEYAAECRKLMPKILSDYGCYIYEIPFEILKVNGEKGSGPYKVWNLFNSGYSEVDGVDLSYFPTYKSNKENLPQFYRKQRYFIQRVYDDLLGFIGKLSEIYKKDENIKIVFAIDELLTKDVANYHFKYLMEQLNIRGIPYGFINPSPISVEDQVRYVVIDLISTVSRMKENCQTLINLKRNCRKDCLKKGRYDCYTDIVYISLLKGFEKEEIVNATKRKIKEKAKQEAERIKREEEEKKRIEEEKRKAEEAERLRKLEEERIRLEEYKRQQDISNLKSYVSSWPQPNRSTLHCFSLYYYYPTTCDWDASEREWDIRNLIWDFKANPNRPQSELEIQSRHKRSMNEILPLLRRVINKFFGSRASKLTLVCIPSSKKIVTERRYKDFSENLCSLTGMKNGYDYVYILNEGEAKHLGGVAQAQFSINSDYFKDKYAILFDDVITSGRSMENFKRLLEGSGAKVIAGLSIGKTRHEREFSQPIDNI